jgi:hypothetical protein
MDWAFLALPVRLARVPFPKSTHVTHDNIHAQGGMNMSDYTAPHRGLSPPVATDHLPVGDEPVAPRARPQRTTDHQNDVVLRYSDSSLELQPAEPRDEDDDPIGYDWEALAEFR